MRYLIAAAVFAASSAHADYVFQNESMQVRLQDAACTSTPVLAQIKPEFHPRFKAGSVVYQGKEYALCWVVTGPDSVVVIDEAGDTGTMPISAFKKAATL